MNEPTIGSPRRPVSDWLEIFADDNDAEAKWLLMPWSKAKQKARADAFRVAADMVRRSFSDNETDKTLPATVGARRSQEKR